MSDKVTETAYIAIRRCKGSGEEYADYRSLSSDKDLSANYAKDSDAQVPWLVHGSPVVRIAHVTIREIA